MIKEFNYTNGKGETKARKVLVVAETKDYVHGIDLNLLDSTMAEKARKENFQVATVVDLTKGTRAELKPYAKACRLFKVSEMRDVVLS